MIKSFTIDLYIFKKEKWLLHKIYNQILQLMIFIFWIYNYIFCTLCTGWSSFYNWGSYRVCEGIGATSSVLGITEKEETTWRGSIKTGWGLDSCSTAASSASILSTFAFAKWPDEACGVGDRNPRRNRGEQVVFGWCRSEASGIRCDDQNPIKEEARPVDQDYCCPWRSAANYPSHQHHHHWTNSSLFIQR